MATINISKVPTGFVLMPAGDTTLKIVSAEGMPRANVTNVAVEFINAAGIKMKNNYNLAHDGGYAAFYFLVTSGCGFSDVSEVDIDELVGKFVDVEIIHKDGTKLRDDGTFPVFANIGRVNGVGAPFGDDLDSAFGDADEDFS